VAIKESDEKYTLEDIEVVHETNKAVLIKRGESGEELWIPLSQIFEIHPTSIVMSAWIAKQKEII